MSSPRASRSVSRGRSRTPIRDDDAQSRSRSRSRSNARSPNGNASPSPAPAVPRSAKIVIEKLTKNVKEAHLREIFSTYGEIEDLEMPMNKHFMTNRGIAYILYTDSKFAESAISNMHEAQLDDSASHIGIVRARRWGIGILGLVDHVVRPGEVVRVTEEAARLTEVVEAGVGARDREEAEVEVEATEIGSMIERATDRVAIRAAGRRLPEEEAEARGGVPGITVEAGAQAVHRHPQEEVVELLH